MSRRQAGERVRLVLAGGGHAHLHVLQDLAAHPVAGLDVTLVSALPVHHYSGMVPGFLQGHYAEAQLRLDLRALAARAGATFVTGTVRCIRPGERTIELDDTHRPFDLLSVNVGSDAAGLDAPGARVHACSVRPMSRATDLRARLDALAARGGGADVVVVGGGAAAVEVALAAHRRLVEAGTRPRVAVCEAGDALMAEFGARVQRRAMRILRTRGITVRLATRIVRADAGAVTTAGGDTLPADLVAWLAGAGAPAVVRDSPVPHDPQGFLLVDDTLRAIDGSPIWGAGDAVAMASHPGLAKAGVYAVRQAPVLAANLRAAAAGTPPVRYRPQKTYLALLNTADGRALLRWRGIVSHSRAAWWLKDRIDRDFVRRYQTAGTPP